MRIGPQGIVGCHQAVGPQLFLVVEGGGWVRDETSERISISAGVAAYWTDGEWRAGGSESGMTVVALEGEMLGSAHYLPKM